VNRVKLWKADLYINLVVACFPPNLQSPLVKEIDRLGKLVLMRSIAVGISISMSACNGGKSLQNTLAPDPQLQQPVTIGTEVAKSPSQPSDKLPADFPLYPQAKIQSTEQTPAQDIVTTWTTPDSIDSVYTFYQKELPAKQWQIVTQPSDSDPQLVAKQAETNVTIAAKPNPDRQQTVVTLYTISFRTTTTPSLSTPTASNPDPTGSPTPSIKPNYNLSTTTADRLTDLTKLGVFTSAETTKIDRVVNRREYARWLVAAYNRIARTKPAQQLKLATTDAKPAFQDVPTTDPDFPSIQGLAEAGLISSPLSGDATAVLFRPNAPLTREQMILWKLPLDTHQPLPAASLDAVKQTWGFQDAGKIEPTALRAVLADFQNGDRSNIRRVFGYTTIFQPKKTVNLGEMAIAIWYFGTNSEGLSAQDALQIN
jgi:S-layer homology domain